MAIMVNEMARIAFLADVHNNVKALERAITDAQTWGAEQFFALGDIGTKKSLKPLYRLHAQAVFGNWEVSRWQELPHRWQVWVRNWPPISSGLTFLAAHATADWPEAVRDVIAAGEEIQRRGGYWLSLFPRMHLDKAARWRALVALGSAGKQLLFYGHTHVQEVWQLDRENRLHKLKETTFTVQPGALYLVGVGSVGQPVDSPGICYARYDEEEGRVTLCRLPEIDKK